jgi:hypothetical protein
MPPKIKPAPATAKKKSDGKFRVRVRMYRQGLGDCFLVTFPRRGQPSFNILIDCGALQQDKEHMTRIVEHIKKTVTVDGKARLDLVVATHEHKDHLSGFNQARKVFNDIDVGGVWMGWTENLTKEEAKRIKQAKKTALNKLKAALASPFAAKAPLAGVSGLLAFSDDDDKTGTGTIAEALEYLKQRGKDAGVLKFLEPGEGPLTLEGVEDVRVYVLGPPLDPILLKSSEVTEQMKKDDVIYHLGRTGFEGMDALTAALPATGTSSSSADERYHPFAIEHRIPRNSVWFPIIEPYITHTYDAPGQKWRQIEDDWLNAFGQLALDLDSDTNNTSLVLAFELVKSKEVLLFVGDAQVGNWQSWAKVSFKVPGAEKPLPAHDLLRRTVFYKVGHHCSHNATIRKDGLSLMESKDLVAFIPLDKTTAAQQGKKDRNGKPKGWDMPAKPLYNALLEKAANRVVISDVTETVPQAALEAGVTFDKELTFIDYTL